MKIHTVTPDPRCPRHGVGEVVWATFGNYIENLGADGKMRPVVILRAGDCQHWVAGVTTQPRYKGDGQARVAVPLHRTCSLCRQSFLWSPKPTYLCRLDVRSHIGWIGHDVIDVIANYMRLPWHVLAELRAGANAQSNTCGTGPLVTT